VSLTVRVKLLSELKLILAGRLFVSSTELWAMHNYCLLFSTYTQGIILHTRPCGNFDYRKIFLAKKMSPSSI